MKQPPLVHALSEDPTASADPVLSLEHVSKHYPPPPPMRLRRFFARFGGLHVEDGYAADALSGQELDDDEDMTGDDLADDVPQPQQAPAGRRVVDDVTLRADAASVVALVGPPGAGKTVLLKLIGGLVPPSDGRVVVRGTVAPALNSMSLLLPSKGQTVKAALPQLGAIVGIAPAAVRSKFDAIEELLATPQLLKSSTGLMESRRKRELVVAMALSLEPDILLLDVPIRPDEFGDRCMRRLDELRAYGTLVVAETRDLRKMRLTPDRVVVVDRGRVLGNPPA